MLFIVAMGSSVWSLVIKSKVVSTDEIIKRVNHDKRNSYANKQRHR